MSRKNNKIQLPASAVRKHHIRSPRALRAIKDIDDERTRNLLRGLFAQQRRESPPLDTINSIRASASPKNLAISAEVIFGKQGAFPHENISSTYQTLINVHYYNKISPASEAAFVSGHLNGWHDDVCNIIRAMLEFSNIVNVSPADAMTALSLFTEKYGASCYVARKVAFIMARYGDDATVQEPFRKISDKVEQSKRAAPYFMSLEAIDSDFQYFSSVSTRAQVYEKYIEDDFRKIFALNELVPVPISQNDASAQLRKSYSSSLVDEILNLIVIMNLSDRYPNIVSQLNTSLEPQILRLLVNFKETKFNTRALYNDVSPRKADFVFYRRSLAFVEFVDCSKYRAFVDDILAPRIIGSLPVVDISEKFKKKLNLDDMARPLNGFRRINDYYNIQNCGPFLKTIQFITFLSCDKSATISEDKLKTVLNRTLSLENLLFDQEIEQLYNNAEYKSKALVTLLALALHKAKKHDEDVDFKFRFAFCDIVLDKFEGSIPKFVDWLLISTPEIANYLIYILDRTTLQKLYWIIKTTDQADVARQAILRSVGKKKEQIQYFVEADAIEARRQVAKLQKYFDDSRIYVDGIAFKRWLISNPSVYAQQYLKLVEHNVDVVTARTAFIGSTSVVFGSADVSTLPAYDYILIEAAKSAFEQFCRSREFGIESYLGRRIRHNTLTGMMRSGVEEILAQQQYFALRVEKEFRQANDSWITGYRSLIEELRRDILQYRSDNRPKGLFSSDIKNDENTQANIITLRNVMLKHRSPELFNELLIRFCWQEIDPQLREIAKYINVDLLQKAYKLVENAIGEFDSDLCRQYRTDVRDALHERFTRLGSWFRQPEDGFVSASARQLADFILVEAKNGGLSSKTQVLYTGSGVDIAMDGLSVHRMYDCLFVLLRNAFSYGNGDIPIQVEVDFETLRLETIGRMTVQVSSCMSNEKKHEHHLKRLEESFSMDETGTAMLIEGYSGIKKLRYITKISEGYSTASFSINDKTVSIKFILTVELAKLEYGENESISH